MGWENYSSGRKSAIISILLWIVLIAVYSIVGYKSLSGNDGLGTVMIFLILLFFLIPCWLLGLYAGFLIKDKKPRFFKLFILSLIVDLLLAVILLGTLSSL